MDSRENLPSNKELVDDIHVSSQIYDPLTTFTLQQIKHGLSSSAFTPTLAHNPKIQTEFIADSNIREQLRRDQALENILRNKSYKSPKDPTKSDDELHQKMIECDEWFSYNNLKIKMVVFHETPGFISSMKVPFENFRQRFSGIIEHLRHQSFSGEKEITEELSPYESPLKYTEKPVKYWVGAGNFLKNRNLIFQALFFYKLAAYVDPFCPKVWIKLIELLAAKGFFKEATVIAKTSFLFVPHAVTAEQYLQLGDKAQIPVHELRGILPSLKNLDQWDRIVLLCSQLEMKKRRYARGVIMLEQYCSLNNFRINFAQGMIQLAKCKQNFQYKLDSSYYYITKIISQGCTKFEAFLLYLEISLRISYHKNFENFISEIQWILYYASKKLTKETLYKFYIELTDTISRADLPQELQRNLYGNFLKKAYESVWEKFKDGAIKEKALKLIYYASINLSRSPPPEEVLWSFPEDDYLHFLENKWTYIKYNKIKRHAFNDWKFYLHYCLSRDIFFLARSSEEWPHIGRIIVEQIHAMRLTQKPLRMLKIWREKIEQVPKSGELWCEGGRIYLNLKQIQQASKCFTIALHYTNQYGDSFFQLLKILLRESRWYEINQLKKNFLMSEPFIGNVLSFLRLKICGNKLVKVSLVQMWDLAISQIISMLYRDEKSFFRQLTACESYNQAIAEPESEIMREKLFYSFEQMENKT